MIDPFTTALIIFGVSAATLTTTVGGISAFIYYSIFRQGLSVVDNAIDRYTENRFIENFDWDDWEYEPETHTYTIEHPTRRGRYDISIPYYRSGGGEFGNTEAYIVGQALRHHLSNRPRYSYEPYSPLPPITVEFVDGRRRD